MVEKTCTISFWNDRELVARFAPDGGEHTQGIVVCQYKKHNME
jgi:hypothetical protein